MASIRYKDPTTGKWELIGSGGSLSNQIVFTTRADFPTVGDDKLLYVDTSADKTYIYKNNTYVLVGDGMSTVDWEALP